MAAKITNLCDRFGETMPPEAWWDVHVAVALSGGADSVALLRAVAAMKHEHGGKGAVHALHVNHHLRGAEADADARWCGELCQKLHIPGQVLDGNVAARAEVDGDGIEAAARVERYALLTTAAEELGARYLFLAHTRDDQVETVMLRLLRGTGLRGLAGIVPRRSLTATLTLVRPLLSCTRHEVLDYLSSLGQDFRTDSSNTDRELTRNRLRADLLPLLRDDYNLRVDDALLRLAAQAGEMQQFVETQAQVALDASREWLTPLGFALNLAKLRAQPSLLTSEVLRLAWREAGFGEQAMTHEWWSELTNIAGGKASNRVLNLPGNVRAEFAGEILTVERQAASST